MKIEPDMQRSKICHQNDFATPGHRNACDKLKEAPDNYHRKIWEFSFIYQTLLESGVLKPNSRGLGFGVGKEPLVAAFASHGCIITATDLNPDKAHEKGWAQTNQHSSGIRDLNQRGICDPASFDRLVEFMEVDMTDIPAHLSSGYDFTWSSCSFEHCGSIQKGIDFVVNQMRCLKPGGIAVHTTEYNLSSNEETLDHADTVIYRRRDIEDLARLLGTMGHEIAVDYEVGEGEIESYVDIPPYTHKPHLRLQLAGYVSTSIGLVIRKRPEPQGNLTNPFSKWLFHGKAR